MPGSAPSKISSRLGCAAAVMAIVSPSHPRPAVIHKISISRMGSGVGKRLGSLILSSLDIRVPSERRRVLISNLQTKPARLFKVSTQLLRPPTFAFTVVVPFVNSGSVKLVDNGVKVIVSYSKCEVTTSIGRFRYFAQLIDLVENNALIRG